MATTINPEHLRSMSTLGVNANEIELMAALEGNAVRINTLTDESLNCFCRDAEIIRDRMDETEETRFTLYDIIEALLDDSEVTDRKHFSSEEEWYEKLIDIAIRQRDRYSKP